MNPYLSQTGTPDCSCTSPSILEPEAPPEALSALVANFVSEKLSHAPQRPITQSCATDDSAIGKYVGVMVIHRVVIAASVRGTAPKQPCWGFGCPYAPKNPLGWLGGLDTARNGIPAPAAWRAHHCATAAESHVNEAPTRSVPVGRVSKAAPMRPRDCASRSGRIPGGFRE